MPAVPFILESNALIPCDVVDERRYLRITVQFHLPRKKRMVVGVIRIVLAGIILRDNGVCFARSRKRPASFSNQPPNDLIQMITGDNLAYNKKRPNAQACTSTRCFVHLRKFCFRKVFQEVCIGIHRLGRSIQALADRCVFRNGIMLFRTVFAIVSIVNIGYSTDRFQVIPCLEFGILTS